jgi:hypothetical protein
MEQLYGLHAGEFWIYGDYLRTPRASDLIRKAKEQGLTLVEKKSHSHGTFP